MNTDKAVAELDAIRSQQAILHSLLSLTMTDGWQTFEREVRKQLGKMEFALSSATVGDMLSLGRYQGRINAYRELLAEPEIITRNLASLDNRAKRLDSEIERGRTDPMDGIRDMRSFNPLAGFNLET